MFQRLILAPREAPGSALHLYIYYKCPFMRPPESPPVRSFLLIAATLPTCERSEKLAKKVVQKDVLELMTCIAVAYRCIRYITARPFNSSLFVDVDLTKP